MILYDPKINKIIVIDRQNIDFETTQSGNSHRGFSPVHNEHYLKLVLGYNEFDYIKYWFEETHSTKGYFIQDKRDIFIIDDNINMSRKLSGCFIKNIETNFSNIRVEISLDYFDVGEFKELKGIIIALQRDKKLEEILN